MSAALIQLLPNSKVLEDTIACRIKCKPNEQLPKDSIDLKFNDFEDIQFRVYNEKEIPALLLINVYIPQWPQIKQIGGDEVLHEVYGPYIAPAGTPVPMSASGPEGHIQLQINVDDVKEDKDALIKSIGLLKTNLLGAALRRLCTNLSRSAAPTPPLQLTVTPNYILYCVPAADRLTVVYSLKFAGHSESVISRVFFQAFVEVQRNKELQGAPVCAYDVHPPNEMKAFNITEPVSGKDAMGYLTLTLLPKHVDTPAKVLVATQQIIGLRSFIQYHIKCSKAYFHARMRARVQEQLKVMARAKLDNRPKKMTTITGRTFTRE